MQKLAFYIPRLNTGGAERVTIDLIKCFAEDPHFDVYLITDKKKSTLLPQLSAGVNLIHLPDNAGLLRRLYRLINLGSIIKSNKFDTLVSHLSHANLHCLIVKLFFRLSKTKLFIVEHSIPSHYLSHLKSLKHKIIFYTLGYFYRKANGVICVSKEVLKDVTTFFNVPRELCYVIYNPINIDRIKVLSTETVEPEITKFVSNKHVLINIGRLEPAKNQTLLLRAFSELNRIAPNCVLIIVGDGSQSNHLKTLAEQLDIRGQVLFLGDQPNPYKYLKLADLLVVSSKFEGFGIVLVEAMLLGKQVVTVTLNACMEILQNMRLGYLSDHTEIDLAKKIKEAIASKTPTEQLEQRAMSFSIQSIYQDYIKILKITK